jgi:hypothetical protein
MSKNPSSIYLHTGQQLFLAHPAKTKAAVCGRGYGKTTMLGLGAYHCIANLPRSRGFFLGLTYSQILTKFLPPILELWERLGLKEHVSNSEPGHYVIGCKPPDHFEQPWAKIKKYQNVISFFNGAYIELLSMDRKDLNRGGSYDWGAADEVQGINRDRFYTEYHVAIRANPHRYNSPYHHTLLLTGSMPWLASGQWILDYEKEALQTPKEVCYLERPSYDNEKALPKDYFAKQKKFLPPMIYAIEIDNKRLRMIRNGFYPEFNDERHTYYAAFQYSDVMPEVQVLSAYTPTMTDYDSTRPMLMGWDFNAGVVSLVLGQEVNDELRIFDLIYETRENNVVDEAEEAELPKTLLQRVLKRFTNKYGTHQHMIHIYGDHTGHNKSDRAPSSFEIIEAHLRKHKMYFINEVEKTTNPRHFKKYNLINDILREESPNLPKIRINQHNCKALIVSMQLAPILPDFSKDKSSERKQIEVECQTHFSDAIDYMIFGRYKNRALLDVSIPSSISIGGLL